MKVNIGKGLEMDVDLDRIVNDGQTGHEEIFAKSPSLCHALAIGFRNILMDSHAGVTREVAGDDVAAQSLAAAQKKLDALYNGVVRVSSTRIGGDPVKAEALRIVLGRIKTAIQKAGKKVSDVDPKALRKAALSRITDADMEKARQRVAEDKAFDDTDDLIEGLV